MTLIKAQAGVKNNVRRLNKSIVQYGSSNVVHVIAFALVVFFIIYMWSKVSRRWALSPCSSEDWFCQGCWTLLRPNGQHPIDTVRPLECAMVNFRDLIMYILEWKVSLLVASDLSSVHHLIPFDGLSDGRHQFLISIRPRWSIWSCKLVTCA